MGNSAKKLDWFEQVREEITPLVNLAFRGQDYEAFLERFERTRRYNEQARLVMGDLATLLRTPNQWVFVEPDAFVMKVVEVDATGSDVREIARIDASNIQDYRMFLERIDAQDIPEEPSVVGEFFLEEIPSHLMDHVTAAGQDLEESEFEPRAFISVAPDLAFRLKERGRAVAEIDGMHIWAHAEPWRWTEDSALRAD